VEASEQSEPPVGRCKDWRAQQPQGAGKVMVRGWCTYPSAAWTLELRRKEPQGSNPAELLLERVEIRRDGSYGQAIKGIEAEYMEETDAEYDTVTILPDGVTIEVEKGA